MNSASFCFILHTHEYVLFAEHLDTTLVSSLDLAQITEADGILKQVAAYIRDGLPRKLQGSNEHLRPFFFKRHELVFSDGIVY